MKRSLLLIICTVFFVELNAQSLRQAPFNPDGEPISAINFFEGRGPNSVVYFANGEPSTFYKATLSSFPGTTIGTASAYVQASEYINGTLYGITYGNNGNTFGTISLTNGAFTQIKADFPNDCVSMCYNPTNGLTYCFGWFGGTFGTVDLTTGNYTHVANVPVGNTSTLYAAIDNDGVCYAIQNQTANFGTVNLATGAFSKIGTMSKTAEYITELSVDRETNEIYWLSAPSPYTVYKINKATGALTTIATVTTSSNPTVFAIATNAPENCDPITNLNIYAVGSNVHLFWTAAPDSPTGYRIDYNGSPLTTVTTTSYTHNSVPDGLHTYMVSALYSSGCIPLGEIKSVIVGDMCIIKIAMHDNYGDGWDDSYIEVSSGGTVYGTATVPNESYGTIAYIVVPSGELQFFWVNTGGMYDNEVSFEIFNADDEQIYSTIHPMPGLFFTYENECGTPPMPCLPAANLKVNYIENCKAELTWEVSPTAIAYKITRDGITIENNVTETNYIDEDFEPLLEHTWAIIALCDGDKESVPIHVIKKRCLGISDHVKPAFTINPNPATNIITISSENNFNTVEVLSLLGQVVTSQSNIVNTNISIDVSNLSNGIFFVRIVSENEIGVQKFVKK